MNNNNTIVTIRCMTFNHKPYIQQCLDGFVMQKTNFPFFAIVVDDASTDNEQEVLWDFINNELDASTLQKKETNDYVRVIATHKTNSNCTFLFFFLKYNHYRKKAKDPYFKEWEEKVKYIAICEGDDYWIDPLKLQKQVDFMESYPDYSLVCSNYHEERNGVIQKRRFHLLEGDCLKDYLSAQGIVPTATTLFLTDDFYEAQKNIPPGKFLMGDVPLWIQLMHKGKVKVLEDITTVYRILNESASHSKNKSKKLRFNKSALEARAYFSKLYGYDDIYNSLKKRIIKIDCELALHEKRYLDYIKLKPWKSNIGLKKTLSIIKHSYKS